MARRTLTYMKIPWAGGLNDSVDPGVLPDSDLVEADNILFSTAGARIKRPGLVYFDNIALPSVSTVTRSGTTISIKFASSIQPTSPTTNHILVAGEKITVVTSDSQFNCTDTAIDSITTTTTTNDTINYTVGVTPTAASATFTSLVRSSYIVGVHDFWYFDVSNNSRNNYKIAITSQGKVFKYDTSGNRTELSKTTQAVTFVDSTDLVSWNSHNLKTGQIVSFSSITSTTGITVNTPYFIEVNDANNFYLSSSLGGSRVTLTTNGSGTLVACWANTLPINQVSFVSINEKCIISADGINNCPIIFDPGVSTTTYTYLKDAAPNFSISRLHEGRIITNDKYRPDTINYSASGDHTKWQGNGDSGNIAIGFGDGDPSGILSISPSFKGAVFISKAKTLYRLPDAGIAESRIEKVSNGISAISHNAMVNIDLDDCFFISDRGFHSLATTNAYGDFTGTYISDKIQNSFASFTDSRKKYTSGVYLSKYNSVFYCVSNESGSIQDDVWAYNIKFKEWYKWPQVNLSSVTKYTDSTGTDNIIFGDYESRLVELDSTIFTDYESDTIRYYIKTGKIYVDNNPHSIKAFKRLGLMFKPQGTFSFTVNIKIDNQPVQSITFNKSTSGDLLGSTFVLGQSTLAYSSNMSPFMRPIDGYGRGIEVSIENNGLNEQVAIYGIIVEYVPAGTSQEIFVSGTTTE